MWRPKVNLAKLDPKWSQAVPMPSYTIPECIPAQIHAKGAAWVAFHRCENAVKTHLRTHTPVTSGGPSPPRERSEDRGLAAPLAEEVRGRADAAAVASRRADERGRTAREDATSCANKSESCVLKLNLKQCRSTAVSLQRDERAAWLGVRRVGRTRAVDCRSGCRKASSEAIPAYM